MASDSLVERPPKIEVDGDTTTSSKPEPNGNVNNMNGKTVPKENFQESKKLADENPLYSPEIVPNKLDFAVGKIHEQLEEGHSEAKMKNDNLNQGDLEENNDKRPVVMGSDSRSGLTPKQGNNLNINTDNLLKPQSQGEDAANESPTWFRRFSMFQGTGPNPTNLHSSSNPDDSKRWRELKQVFRFGKQRKEEEQPQQQQNQRRNLDESENQTRLRASNLITTLLSASPAALMVSAAFETDEHGSRRAPILLSLLEINVQPLTTHSHNQNTHHRKFKINLEYGVGPDRLKWFVVKDLRDLISLHSRLKVVFFQGKNFRGYRPVHLPKFPRLHHDEAPDSNGTGMLNDKYLSVSQGPMFRYVKYDDDHRAEQQSNDFNANLDIQSVDSQGRSLGSRLHHALSRVSRGSITSDNEYEADVYAEKIKVYLKKLVFQLALRPQANRLFQFFELSPLSVLLSYENGYSGKQGYLIVGSSAKAQGWRVGHLKASDFKAMVERHTNKWFLVRNSYILYVSDIYSTTVLEVFLIDSSFKVTFSGIELKEGEKNGNGNDDDTISDQSIDNNDFIEDTEGNKKISTHMSIKLENAERQLKVYCRNKYQLKLWLRAIETMQKNTIWSKPQRFESFAPVRQNCFAQWFVDGRDYFWAVSSALELAKDVIYIHDWWLSPELYMRRPANGNQEFRLDRILKRKAEQGIKIFVIVYRNVGSTVATDSLWTKHSLIDLHPNIHVIRSPNQWLQNTYFWAHHEKLCIVDHTVAFLGGIDLCFGRYDTPDHVLVDDSPHDFATKQNANEESIKYQKFPGKDYSNPRVKDFYNLDKPYESMYDRDTVPRMPWHDVHMVTAGQPASDLSRHFVQRWNYLLRQKRPSRPTPLLTPPPEFTPDQLENFSLVGKCEVQLLRSAGNWSLGLQKTEHSIQNAYLKLIETSEYFVYIENQFFVTSCELEGTVIENRIGDALTDRIIRAYNEGKAWKAVIVIPLMPGFESQVDEADGSAVRLIMQCQYMSISRGQSSIFAKLRRLNINPYDYIQFFSLRKWGRIGPNRKLVTEQLYIHAKILLVDDRVALIGSANVNERSQRGNRDSEVAAVVRDSEFVNTTMDGEPYKAARFCHTLRVRLMREHLGVDVDILDIVERRFNKMEEIAKETALGAKSKTNNFSSKEHEITSSMVELASRDVLNMPNGTEKWKNFHLKVTPNNQKGATTDEVEDPAVIRNFDKDDGTSEMPSHLQEKDHTPLPLFYHSFNNRAREENPGIRDKKQFSSDSRITGNKDHKADVEGQGADRMDSKEFQHYKLNAAKTLKKWSKESMVNDATAVFLPNIEQVLEFLGDDEIVIDPTCLSEEEEILVNERNQERWDLLKRVAYLQRVAAKQKIQNDEENAKRVQAGLPSLNTSYPRKNVEKGGIGKVQDSVIENKSSEQFNPNFINDVGVDARPSNDFREVEDLPGENIPVLALDSQGIREVLLSLGDEPQGSKENRFIDPYCFSDPLDDSFYEDVWFENALRNTRIFREVFHCQPDDMVSSWKEYKEFTKRSLAFGLAQDQEINHREELMKTSTNSTPPEQLLNSRAEGAVVTVDDLKADEGSGLFKNTSPQENGGMEPKQEQQNSSYVDGRRPAKSNSTPNLRRGKKSSAYGLRKKSPLMSNKVYERETADRLLSEIQGHLVLFPVDWLYKEVESGNWFYNMDRLPPIEIYD